MEKLILILITLGLFGCYSDEKTIKWINKADKPIICRQGGHSADAVSWTLIDANGNVHRSGRTLLNLPDTIR